MTTALPTYRLPEEYRQQGDFQGYGAPYEQLRNQDLTKMASILMSENRGVNVANYPYDLPQNSARPTAEEAANLPMFGGYGAPYEQLRNQDLAKMANILMSENRGVNVANYPYDLPQNSARPTAEEAANLPMFGDYGAPYEQLRNQNFPETAKIPNLPMFEMPEDNRFMQVDKQDEQNKGDMQRYGYGLPPSGR